MSEGGRHFVGGLWWCDVSHLTFACRTLGVCWGHESSDVPERVTIS